SGGVLLAKGGRVIGAAGAFERYRGGLAEGERPAAGYFVFAPVVEAACGRPERGKQLCDEGVLHYPHVAPLLLHSGAIRERSGSSEEAEVFYRRAVEEDPELPDRKSTRLNSSHVKISYAVF